MRVTISGKAPAPAYGVPPEIVRASATVGNRLHVGETALATGYVAQLGGSPDKSSLLLRQPFDTRPFPSDSLNLCIGASPKIAETTIAQLERLFPLARAAVGRIVTLRLRYQPWVPGACDHWWMAEQIVR
jgi:hypothetical protein